ncbi:neuroligin-4, Y-linked-like [Ruditapes philippinarum]|uniref:neuroligin-4, Y-linked-like n=1 Tax=Ruditapes philippinarum TaxID=129788 RepID=UPI00295BB34B|nr:neuroligin-4, Y-linked-like [Ruditapes philippinarum]
MELPVSVWLFFSLMNVNSGFLIPDRLHKVTTTKYGDIIGFIDQIRFDGRTHQIRKYLGIPYAEPPLGNLRFEKPVMKKKLSVPFQAQKYALVCPQTRLKIETMSEDCLYLNVFVPETPSINSGPKPVMVFIHGGGFVGGYSNVQAGDVISAVGDVIIVTMNYRLGVLGFLSTHDSTIKGNYGLWDQHLAIRWVNDNIADFGGDINNITIFGESAGSSSVIYQTLYPGNKHLFKRAIAESGSVAAWAVSHGNTNHDSSVEFAQSLGCNDLANILLCLQSKSQTDVINATLEMESRIFNEVNRSWVPVFDDEFVLAKTPAILSELSNPKTQSKYSIFRDIDLMIGVNNYDGVVYQTLLSFYLNVTSDPLKLSQQQFNDIVVPRAVEAWLGEMPTQDALDLTIYEYTTWDDLLNVKRRIKNVVDIVTDYALNAPTISTARSHINDNSSTYVYQFSASPPKRLLPVLPFMDGKNVASHADELPYVFGFTENLRSYWNMPESMIEPNDYKLSREMITMWTNFAKSGNPNSPVPLNGSSWPAYDNSGEMYLEIKSDQSYIQQRLRAEQVVFWNSLLPDIQSLSKKQTLDCMP